MAKAAKVAPSSKKPVLVYVSRLSQEEAGAIFNVAKVFQNNQLRSELLVAVGEVAQDRVVRAVSCLKLAKSLYADGKQESLRTAINRAYYSAHHSIRAMVLRWQNSDPDGHAESIKVLEGLLKESKFAKLAGLSPTIADDVRNAMNNRHIADYSPYDESRYMLLTLRITGNNWKKASEFNIHVAEKLLAAARKVI